MSVSMRRSEVRFDGNRKLASWTGRPIVRTIGIVRARAKIGLQHLVYNIRRLVTLERMAVA
jgi:hypothetical protein